MKTDNTIIENLYNRITNDEDARVCKDIPESACNDQPRNFFAYLGANALGKVADEIGSAKLIIPWVFGMLAVPAVFTGFLVPIREAGVLLPQLAVAAAVRRVAIRKTIWLIGSILSALSMFGMAYAAVSFEGVSAGVAIILMLIIFSLSRGLCSVSAKDVLGKTVSKSRRGALMGWSSSISGVAVIFVGLWLGTIDLAAAGIHVFASLLIAGGILWVIATAIFASIIEQPGATEGGGNALTVALKQLSLLKTDEPFRRFVTARGLLLSVALVQPFYVLIVQANVDGNLLGLGALIIANGVAASISAPVWGYMGDQSSKRVMAIATTGCAAVGLFTFAAVSLEWQWVVNEYGFALIFLVLNVVSGGVRLGRKIYLVDMATGENRAAYVAVSNTVIGVLMLFGGFIGLLGDWWGPEAIVLFLALCSLLAVAYIKYLPDVSEPES